MRTATIASIPEGGGAAHEFIGKKYGKNTFLSFTIKI